jgi:3-methylcrotonyl-CoA carboxylase alpha subunit
MNYPLKIQDEVETLEYLPARENDEARVTVRNTTRQVTFQTIDAHQLRLVVDGQAVRAFVAQGPGEKHVALNGRVYRVREIVPAQGRRRAPGPEEASGKVTPPMPAVVIRLLVTEGEDVVQGQGLVVVAAMKMETTLKAPFDGVVRKINTALQTKVMPGDRLIEIERRNEL